jgi:hypothetical protein
MLLSACHVPIAKAQTAAPTVEPRALPVPVRSLSAANAPVTVARAGWRLELFSEEPTQLFWDRETIQTRTAPLFSIRVTNGATTSRAIHLTWRVLDTAGKVWLRRSERFNVNGRGVLNRRELFEASKRGAYVLRVEADGGQGQRFQADLPFAIAVTPSGGFRPRSFFALNAPAQSSRTDLDFYTRIGARVLRSSWIADNSGENALLDEQLRARLERNLATIGVLSPPSVAPKNSLHLSQVAIDKGLEDISTRRIVAPLARYPLVSRWDVLGLDSSSEQVQLLKAVNAARPGYLAAEAAPKLPKWLASEVALSLPSGIGVPWPSSTLNASPSTLSAHPAAVQRSLFDWNRTARAASLPFYLHEVGNQTTRNASAGSWVTNYALAIMSGANGFSASLDGAIQSTLGRVGINGMARAAAFAHLTRTLEDTAYVGELFPRSPLVWGALFQGTNSHVALIWAAPENVSQDDGGRLVLRFPRAIAPEMPPLQVLDLYGNELLRTRERKVALPLGNDAVYVRFAFEPALFEAATRSAEVQGLTPLAAQVLPITQRPGNRALAVRVKLQNLVLQPLNVSLKLVAPAGWKLAQETATYQMAPGQTRIVAFLATPASKTNTLSGADFTILASTQGRRWQWRQNVPVAFSSNWRAGQTVRIDGNLIEWRDATWLHGATLRPAASGQKNVASSTARVALRWDATRLYVAVRVEDAALQSRRENEDVYRFWNRNDAVQLVWGVRDTLPKYFSRAPQQDVDYGFLLSPFRRTNGAIEGRVLRLWNPATPFGASLDAVRWGGAVPGAYCAVGRDSRHKITFYEASLPLNEMRELRPPTRLSRSNGVDAPVRFAWMVHSSENRPVVWPAPQEQWSWEHNSRSFFPPGQMAPTVPALLGWTQNGRIASDAQAKNLVPRRTPTQRSPIQSTLTRGTRPSAARSPQRAASRTSDPTPPASETLPARRSSGSSLPQVLPMPPNTLPPAAISEGQLLPPQAPS